MSDAPGEPDRLVRENQALRSRVTALEAEAERFKTTLQSIGDAVISVDTGGNILQMNPVAQTLTGWGEPEALGQPLARVFRIVNEETRAEVESPVERVLREGMVVGLANHTLLIAKDGKERPIADSGAPIRNAKGETTGVVLVFRDQTEERAAQRALQQSEEKYRGLFDNAEVGMYRSRLDGSGIIALNQRLADIFGFSKEEMMASPATIRWADSGARGKMVRLVRQRGELRDHELDIVTKGGEVRTVLASMRLYPDEGYLEGTAIDITERKRIEAKLQESEALYRSLFENMMNGFAYCQMLFDQGRPADFIYLDVNRAFEAQTGLRNVVGRKVSEVIPGIREGNPELLEIYGRVAVSGRPEVFETHVQALDMWFAISVHSPKPEYFVAVFDVITERKRAEAALRESEQRLRRFYESGLLGVIFWNMRGQITDANDKFLDMVGYTRAELNAGQIDWLNMTPPEYRHLDDASVVELKATGVNRTPLEKEYIRKDGSRIPIAVAGAMLDDERVNGVAFVQDITERRRAEQEIESLAKFPRENPNPILRVRHDGKILYANPSSKDLLVTWSCAVGDSLPSNLQNTIAISVAEVESATVDVVCNHRVFSVLFVPIPGTDYVNLYGRDVTERVRAEEAVRLLNTELEQRVRDRTAQLEESNRELEAFSYSVSHDLRAPLRAIDGFTRILADDYAPHLDTEGQRLCSVIHENTGKMSGLIDDLLAFSRLGRAEMTFSRIDMGSMASAVFHELTTAESRRRIDFQVGALPSVVADPTLMRQVWMNLLSNAIKFSSKQERAVIKVSARENGGERVYVVQDNGAGFDMQYVGKLFGVFQRLHSSKEFEGTGVGLALVQRVIRRHGGRVWAEGEPDKGATFYLALQQRGA